MSQKEGIFYRHAAFLERLADPSSGLGLWDRTYQAGQEVPDDTLVSLEGKPYRVFAASSTLNGDFTDGHAAPVFLACQGTPTEVLTKDGFTNVEKGFFLEPVNEE